MQRIIRRTVVPLLFLVLAHAAPATAWIWGPKALVTINGVKYTEKDIRKWWDLWKEPGLSFPDTPEPFVRWKLLAEEGRNMGLDQTPEFARKMEVFVKVRAMMALKREEIDKKIKITPEQIREVYDRDYRPLYDLQLLYYDTRDKAEEARKSLEPFIGKPAGKLVFADLQGVKKEDGGPIRYQEVSVSPKRVAEQDPVWQQEIDKLSPGGISEVFENNRVFVILRFDGRSEPGPEDFAKHEKTIRYNLWKKEQARLTNELIARLGKKFGLDVDDEVFSAITVDRKDYDRDFRDRVVARIKDVEIKAGTLIDSINRERRLRRNKKYDAEEFERLKKIALGSMYSQSIIIWEALARHYEKKEPLKSQLAFYAESQLNNAVRKRLAELNRVTDEDVKKYYEDNRDHYTEPARVAFMEVTADKELIGRAWKEIQAGADFSEVVRRNFHHDANLRRVRTKYLVGQVRNILEELSEGEVSRPFLFQGKYYMLKLVSKKSRKYIPFDRVEKKIREKLDKEKFEAAFEDFVGRLKAANDVKTDDAAWAKLKAAI